MNHDIFLESQSDDYLFPHNEKLQKSEQDQLFEMKNEFGKQILPAQCSTIAESNRNKEKDQSSHRGSSKKLINSAAGKQARERKKKHLEGLETSVQQLEMQVKRYEEEIQKTKETLSQTLNSTKNNQNAITYSELQLCIQSEDPNEDKINLLLDMIKFRIGASGHQRQAKIEYFFKQLVNTLFPAIHRYLMYCSDKNLDLFEEHSIDQFFGTEPVVEEKHNCLPWTADFLSSLQISSKQRQEMLKLTQKYIDKKLLVKKIISSLKEIKESIKAEEEVFQNITDEIRSGLRPVQAAVLVLFSDKSKYKREITLEKEGEFDLFNRMDDVRDTLTKKVKLD